MSKVLLAKKRKRALDRLFEVLNQVGFGLQKELTPYDVNYRPNPKTRSTTNFANLARGDQREVNLNRLFFMINSRLNSLLSHDNPEHKRYKVHLSILTVRASFGGASTEPFPISEMLHAEVEDTIKKQRLKGPIGFNFSSYIRDYDFKKLGTKKEKIGRAYDSEFGKLHGLLYQLQFKKFWDGGVIDDQAIIAISVSSKKTYKKTSVTHPVLGEEFSELGEMAYTTKYFQKMGLNVKFFMPPDAMAPLAIYHMSETLDKYDLVELSALVAVMESFQKIYRPEIYNANSKAPPIFKPSLSNGNYSLTKIKYDRVERESLGESQAQLTEQQFLRPYNEQLSRILNAYSQSSHCEA
jgi:Putative oxygenase MesX